MINTSTLAVRSDYSRITHPAHALSVNYSKLSAIKQKIIAFLKVKCHPIFLDLVLNGRDGVITNISQNVHSASRRLVCYLDAINCFDSTFILKCIDDIFTAFRRILHSRSCAVSVRDLFYRQVFLVFSRFQTRWRGVVKGLKERVY